MDTSDKDINWDKLLAALEGTNTEPLNAAEEAMLQASAEIQERIKMRSKFPAEQGWNSFTAARDAREPKIVWWKSTWKIAAAAAVLALIATAGLRWLKQPARHQQPIIAKADQKASRRIELLRANGEKVVLDSGLQTLQDSSGAKVQASDNSIVYHAGKGTATVNKMDTLLVPRGNKIRVVLVDGTAVWVNADTRLVCPTAFTGSTRDVWLDGEAFFEVAPQAQQPFQVHTSAMDVQVLGTTFNISTYVSAEIQTTLASGKVRVGAGSNSIILTPGQQASYNEESGALISAQVDVRLYTAWKDNNIYFEDAPLSDITSSLSRTFDYDFKFEDASLAKLSFTLDMQQPATLQEVLNKIHLTIGDIKFRVTGRTVYISR